MKYWWVNQGRTHTSEFLWAPKRQANGSRSRAYDNMLLVAPGDAVLSFFEGRVRRVGTPRSHAHDWRRPGEYGDSTNAWRDDGRRVNVEWKDVDSVDPYEYVNEIRASQLSTDIVMDETPRVRTQYLFELGDVLGPFLLQKLGITTDEFRQWSASVLGGSVIPPDELPEPPESDNAVEDLDSTTREAIVEARRGQGTFRRKVAIIEERCRVTGVSTPCHLRASHIKPWRACSNTERLDGDNGLLLAPTIDHLFDAGFLSFEDTGEVLVSELVDPVELARLVPNLPINVGPFSRGQAKYLRYHREFVFRRRS